MEYEENFNCGIITEVISEESRVNKKILSEKENNYSIYNNLPNLLYNSNLNVKMPIYQKMTIQNIKEEPSPVNITAIEVSV